MVEPSKAVNIDFYILHSLLRFSGRSSQQQSAARRRQAVTGEVAMRRRIAEVAEAEAAGSDRQRPEAARAFQLVGRKKTREEEENKGAK